MISAHEALERLQAGNRRFVSDMQCQNHHTSTERRCELATRQEPFATILGCSDSRVPAEIVFDQGLGDLFVIRVAGNVVAPSLIGSVEFAAHAFGTPLVIVLGHTGCGAIKATLDALEQPEAATSPNLRSIVERVSPAVERVMVNGGASDRDTLERQAVRANVRASVDQLEQGSEILTNLVKTGKILIVGAEYSLESGIVDFFDEDPVHA